MNKDLDPIKCDLTVIGAGMAGMTATLFAVNRGLSVCQIGAMREIGFASGLFDLLGVHPISIGKQWDNPWAAIETLIHDLPKHPYALLSYTEIRSAFNELLTFLDNSGLPYNGHNDLNTRLITYMGTVKTTYCAPQTMWNGAEAFKNKRPCIIVDFNGLRGFNAGMIVETLKKNWPGLRATRITYPYDRQTVDVSPEHVAGTLAISQNREKLAGLIRPHILNAEFVGMPAVLGLHHSALVAADLEKRIGVPIFEISTMPPSIPGLRLKEAFESGLREKRPNYFSQASVLDVNKEANGEFKITLDHSKSNPMIFSKGIILATGRFLGGGLSSDRKRIRETIFNLPVYQPKARSQWHRENCFDLRGHPINQAGLETDDQFCPLGYNGRPAFKNLFAVGSILAHQDWKRMKCGTGLATATSFCAVKFFIEAMNKD